MGAEALCRGASVVIGIEQSSRACAVIEQNWSAIAKPNQRFQLLRGDVLKRLENLAGQQFDRIYFDPPYASGLYNEVVAAIARLDLLSLNGELAAEHHPDLELLDCSTLKIIRQKRYCNTALTFYAHEE